VILTRDQILGCIKKPKNENLIGRAREIFTSHRLHVKGIGVQDFLAKIEGYENKEQYELRKTLAKPATVPIVGNETDRFTKVFSAQGFSRYYQFDAGSQERLDNDFRNYMASDIGDGENLSQWMRQWLDKVNYDSSGVLMVELPAEPTPVPEPYLTFRSILEIHDYWFKGNKVEYIIFQKLVVEKDKRYMEYRVVDDKFDYIVREKDGALLIIDELTLVNPFGFVPARIISNQRDSESNARTSYIWKAIKTCDEYLLDASIQVITKKLHGFPRFWTRRRDCRKCKGSGYIATIGLDKITPISNKCEDCNGVGHAIKQDVSDITILPTITEQGQPDNIPAMGYVQPELDTPKQQVEELERLQEMIHTGIWGDDDITTSSSEAETATGRVLDAQQMYEKLTVVSQNAQEVELFITNTFGAIRYGSAFKGAIINYGKRYFIRTADEVEQLYMTAKKGGLPSHLLDAYIEELIYIRFGNDPMELQRQLKLNQIEPFIHLTDAELKGIEATREDKLLKVYFTDYIERYEREVKPVVISTEAEIIAKLDEYNREKLLQLGGGQAIPATT
jgi:hypothetical protein